jgi:hypothetical protein
MPTANQLGHSRIGTWQGIRAQSSSPCNKENTPIAARRAEALRLQSIMSPEIAGLEVPKVIKDVFYGKVVINIHIFSANCCSLRSACQPPPSFRILA